MSVDFTSRDWPASLHRKRPEHSLVAKPKSLLHIARTDGAALISKDLEGVDVNGEH